MIRLLIVDDEANIRAVVREYAQLNDYFVDEAENGLEALQLVKKNAYDCIILDVMMPGLDGFTACKQIKRIKNVPIIMLSARQEEYDKLYGFELGVDDYVAKPFSPKELMARVKVILDRSRKNAARILTFDEGGLVVDYGGRTVTVDRVKVDMTPKEMDLLLYMVDHQNLALSRTKLLEDIWNYDYFGDYRTVDAHIKMLRQSLGPYKEHIVTVRGMGYKFEA